VKRYTKPSLRASFPKKSNDLEVEMESPRSVSRLSKDKAHSMLVPRNLPKLAMSQNKIDYLPEIKRKLGEHLL
jgi:hypothetical protein